MQDSFTVCGFLYNTVTEQILLLQSNKNTDLSSSWSMIGAEGKPGEDPKSVFQDSVRKLLKIKLDPAQIYHIYDYRDKKSQKVNYVFYVEVDQAPKLDEVNENKLTWITFGETMKLLFTSNTKQDVIVGQRVINLKVRLDHEHQIVSSEEGK